MLMKFKLQHEKNPAWPVAALFQRKWRRHECTCMVGHQTLQIILDNI